MLRIPATTAGRKSHCAHKRNPASLQAKKRRKGGKHTKRRVIPVHVLKHRVHAARLMTNHAFRREVERVAKAESDKLRRLAAELPADDLRPAQWARATKTVESKARSYQSCGQVVAVRACGGCGKPRPKTASSPPGEERMRCDMDCCESCGRRSADILARKLQSKLAAIPLSDKCYLMLITFTEVSAPTDPAEYTTQRLRERAKALKAGIQAVWDSKRHLGVKMKGELKQGKPTSTCLYYRVEVSENGAIHAHGIYYGPWRNKEQVEAILKSRWPAAGFVDIQKIANTKEMKFYQELHDTPEAKLSVIERSVNSKIREVTKYTVKGPSPFDESHLAGAPRWRLDPALAAKWEIATHGMRLSEWYGTLRGTATADAAAEASAVAAVDAEMLTEQQLAEQDDDVACDCCGLVGEWSWGMMPVQEYVASCHSRRQRAFARSRWVPPPPQRE